MALSHGLSRLGGFLLLTTHVVHFTDERACPPLKCWLRPHVGIPFQSLAECFSLAQRPLGFHRMRRAEHSEKASSSLSQLR